MTKRLYIYAITDTHIRVDDVQGVAKEALQILNAPAPTPTPADAAPAAPASATAAPAAPAALPAPACCVIVGELPERPTATRESLAAQDAVIRRLAARAEALLPMRFGTMFDDETTLAEALGRLDDSRLRDALSRVRGCEQMTLRFFRTSEAPARADSAGTVAANAESSAINPGTAPLAMPPVMPPAMPPATPPAGAWLRGAGTAYLQARAAAIAEATQSPLPLSLPAPQLQALRQQLRDVVRDEIVEAAPATRAPLVASLYHLIPRGHDARYRAIAAAWPAPGDLIMRISGPAPAYAFAKDALS